MFRRHQLSLRNSSALRVVSVAFVAGFVAVSANGCSDPAKATSRVAFESEIQPGSTHKSTECGKTGPWFSIGTFGNPQLGRKDPADPNSPLIQPVVPVDDGAPDQQGTVAVSCAVTVEGDGFKVAAHAELTGATGGAVTIQGHFTATGPNTGITVALTRRGETFTDTNCTATFDPLLNQAVAGGRVWAQVECANAAYPAAQQICSSSAQFRFENCTQ